MSNRQPTEEMFLSDVSKHKMTVLLDNGVYRHLRFSSGSFNMQFDIVTYPWHLVYSGDMGSFVFSRLDDMFEFFRSRPSEQEEKLFINTGYWGEKLQAVDRCGRESGHLQFAPERLREYVEQSVKQWIEDCPIPYDSDAEEEAVVRHKFETELREAIEEDIYRYLDDGEHEARRAVNEFSFQQRPERFDRDKPKYEFSDTWEWDCTEYTFRFVWCCYALAWGIQQYDVFKGQAVECLST